MEGVIVTDEQFDNEINRLSLEILRVLEKENDLELIRLTLGFVLSSVHDSMISEQSSKADQTEAVRLALDSINRLAHSVEKTTESIGLGEIRITRCKPMRTNETLQ